MEIKKILESLLKTNNFDYLEKISSNWDKFLPEIYANESEPVILNKKRLIVKVNSSSMVYSLLFKKRMLINKINSFFNEIVVDDISFRQ